MENTVIVPKHVSAAQGRKLTVIGQQVSVKLHAVEANDTYVFELITPPGAGVPPHVHQDEDELIYVVSGEFDVMIGEEKFRAGAGSWLNFIRHIPHAFVNAGNQPGKTLWYVNPGKKFEAFFEELAALPAGPPDPAVLVPLFARFGMEILPPQ